MTTTIVVRRRLRARPEDVFGTFADSTRLGQVRGIRVEVLDAGSGSGIGLRRKVSFPAGIFLLERIVHLDTKNLVFDYRIEDSRPRFEHERGRITFVQRGEGTSVTWTSQISRPMGVLTPVAEFATKAAAIIGFRTALALIDRQLRPRATN